MHVYNVIYAQTETVIEASPLDILFYFNYLSIFFVVLFCIFFFSSPQKIYINKIPKSGKIDDLIEASIFFLELKQNV